MEDEAPKIDVLDHGYVRLIASMGNDLTICRSARVSYDADWRAGDDDDKDSKLIQSMMRRGHTSPFEHVVITFEVKAPIFVLRQWHRHRTWSYSELSARYAPMKEEFYVPDALQITQPHEHDKQMRSDKTIDAAHLAQELIADRGHIAYANYQQLLQLGVARELARTVLPVNMYSRMFATVNLWNFFRFVKLRSDEHAQYEIRVYSDAMLKLAEQIAPVAVKAFIDSLNKDSA
jgi:thymidylate synthase (FAD)